MPELIVVMMARAGGEARGGDEGAKNRCGTLDEEREDGKMGRCAGRAGAI